ncbi:MAG: histidine triad nucleotide-binding protein [Candidatus Hydrogenedentes bacterium]|nr:histidine triad nucleotide-binding protein [Candidatus Hydrogenedentota bacterium]
MSEETLFTKIIRGEIPSEEVYSDDEFYAFRDINPQAPTHVLVVPKEPIAKVGDASDADADMLGRLLLAGNRVAKQEGLEDYRLVINNGAGAGQTVFHLHLHVLGGRPMDWPPG